MAWLGLVALVGLGLCALWLVADRLHLRRTQPNPMLIAGIALGAVVLVGAAVFLAVINATGSGTSTKAGVASSTARSHARPSRPLRVEVLNASRVPGAAAREAATLVRLGYVVAGIADAPVRRGSAVECHLPFVSQAAPLARRVGAGTVVEPLRQPPPKGAETSDCVVILGR